MMMGNSFLGVGAFATLGEQVESIEADRHSMSATRKKPSPHPKYSVHNLETNTSIQIREYVSHAGTVFGIGWNGMSYPDLTQLLGSFVSDYQDALKKNPRRQGRRHHAVHTNRLVIEKWGHMRNLQGRAYIRSLIPPGVTPDEIN